MRIWRIWRIGLAKPALRLWNSIDTANIWQDFIRPCLQIEFFWYVSKYTPWWKVLNIGISFSVILESVGPAQLIATREEIEDLLESKGQKLWRIDAKGVLQK